MEFEKLEKKLPEIADQLKAHREVILANLVMIGEIPAPTFEENTRLQFLINRFNEAGLTDSSIDESGNGIGVLAGKESKKSILINAHADTVFPSSADHTLQVSNGKVTGPGVADNSLGLAVLASLPYLLDELNIRFKNDLIFLGGVKSLGRGDLQGIRFFLENNPFKISEAICIEGVELERLSYSSIGMLRGEITCSVPDSYDWSRFGDASAILTLNEVINKINDIRLPKRPRTSIVMGSIVGGDTSFNTIARDATLGFEVRSESQEVVEDVGNTIEDLVMEVSSKTGDDIELDIFAKRSPGGIPYGHPITQCAKAVMKTLDIEPRLAPSTSELSALIDKKIPALTLGITKGDRIHKMNETIQIDPIYKGIAQIIGTLIAIDGEYFG